MWPTRSGPQTTYRPKGSNNEGEAHHCAPGRGVCPRLVSAAAIRRRRPDPRSPINQGTLCPKGAATFGWLTSPDRLTKVLYRAPHGETWEERPLGWAMDRIATSSNARATRALC